MDDTAVPSAPVDERACAACRVVASRLVFEVRRGMEFPPGWAENGQPLNVGMARELVASVAVMFDDARRPLAACWQVAGGAEAFLRAGDGAGAGLPLDDLARDMEGESRRLGAPDLLATLLWSPDELRPDQGQWAHRIVFGRGRYESIVGWNIPPRTLVARAASLLVISRRVDDDLGLPVPATLQDMHGQLGDSDPRLLLVLPGAVAVTPLDAHIGRKLLYLIGGLLLAGCLICAHLLDRTP